MRKGIVVAASLALVLGCGNKEAPKTGSETQKPATTAKPLDVHKVDPAAGTDPAKNEEQKVKPASNDEAKPAAPAAAEEKKVEPKAEEPKAEGKPQAQNPETAAGEAEKPAADKAGQQGTGQGTEEAKPAAEKPAEVKPVEAAPAEPKPAEPTAEAKPADGQVAAAAAPVAGAEVAPKAQPADAGKTAPAAPAEAKPAAVVASAAGTPAGGAAGMKLPKGASMTADGDYIPPPFQNLDDTPEDQKAREAMIKRLKPSPRHNDPKVLRGMAAVPRHMYMLAKDRKEGYVQNWFRIGHGQTITDPATVARMTQILAIKPTDKVLEIGTGSGYQGSVLAQLTPNVYTIEIVEPLAKRTHALLEKLGYKEAIHTKIADGYYGWEEEAPFDKIIVTCAADHIPIPLLQQLKPGGLMVIPVGPRYQPGKLYFIAKDDKGQVHRKVLINVKFVPMTKLTDWGKEDPRAEERKKYDREGRKQMKGDD